MGSTERLRVGFASPPSTARPLVRWWWFGPTVERAELDRELAAVAAAGLGGVEVAFVYPLSPVGTPFGSEPLLTELAHAAVRAAELGLRFDLTLGSGWSFGGPHVGPGHAARRLHWEEREIGPAPLRVGARSPWPGDVLVAAFVGQGSGQERPEDFEPLPLDADGVDVPAGRGPRVLLLAWSQLTGQNVKRAAAGAEGPVLDHYAAAAVTEHLHRVGDAMLDAVGPELVGSVFCDSLEVYRADWTPAMLVEFERRRGYGLLPLLWQLRAEGPDSRRVRVDFHRTLTELYEENFVAVVRAWAARRGVPLRLQGYGCPPAALSSYRHADLFEGEGRGWRTLTPSRWAASAAHRYRREVVSAEVWTWVHSPSFRATPLDLQGEAHEHLLQGVNQLFGHGWPYSPPETPGLGWFFYAAGALDDRNPWWPVMPGLTTSLTRSCWLLRQGEPVADVAVVLPEEDVLAAMGEAVGGSLDAWRETARRVPAALLAAVRESGLDYDLLDEAALAGLDPARYPVVLVAAASRLTPGVSAWLEAVVAAGGQVRGVAGEADVPGARLGSTEVAGALAELLAPRLAVDPPAPGLGCVVRRLPDVDLFWVANTTAEPVRARLRPRSDHPRLEVWDPVSGDTLATGSTAEGLSLTVQPYQALVLLAGVETPGEPVGPVGPPERSQQTLALPGPWRVSFGDAVAGSPDPGEVVELPHVWEESDRASYSGTATYRTTFTLDPDDGPVVTGTDRERVWWLDLGASTAFPAGPHPAHPQSDDAQSDDAQSDDAQADDQGLVGPSYRAQVRGPVGEVAVVDLDGRPAGVVWAPPYLVRLGPLGPGLHQLSITVANTAANALAADEHVRARVAEAERRHGRRFRMQELDRAVESVRSGLLARPVLLRQGSL